MDIAEVREHVAEAAADLPLAALQASLEVLDEQRSHLAEALSGTGSEDAKAALAAFEPVAERLRRAVAAYRAAVSCCDDYLDAV
ncbi:hypothetical protein Afil01_23310 [Actinorhabdospora filicis]|uniref:Uncharacterized protein n=1 Tax=Actinorhabdospora filicis TaxID=1785913 RepID=A0A9W6W8E9_9ACTN|nr:hypothetical protein [Actinorhabdospora filicis]GLZ77524.1 hypothetical protein Afil01_23310 [Actinorhabdospora filicis]